MSILSEVWDSDYVFMRMLCTFLRGFHYGILISYWPCRGSGGWAPSFHRGYPGLFPGQSVLDLWWTKWHWDTSVSSTSIFRCQYCSTTAPCYGINLISTLYNLNPLNPKLNPICYLLALLGAHHFLHVSRIRVKSLTFRLLMSYIYIWSTHSWCF